MKKIITIILLLFCFNLSQSDEPLYNIDGFTEENLPLFNLMMKDIYNKQNTLSVQNETITKTITTSLTTILAQDVQTDGINNLNYNNVQDNLNELDNEKLSRKGNTDVKYNTMEKDLLLGGAEASNINLSIGADTTPSYPLQIDRQAPQIVIKNSLSAYPFSISVPESTNPKSFVIGSVGVQDELEIETVDNRTYLSRPVVFGLKSAGSISRYISDDSSNYEIDVSTKANFAGALNVSGLTTATTIHASGYGIVTGTFTVGKMVYVSSITPTGTVDDYDVSNEFYTLKNDTGTLDTNKLDKSSATTTYVFKTGDTMSGLLKINNGGLLCTEMDGSIPIEGAGTRLMWYPAKAAFRAGTVDGAQWNDTNIGIYSFASGYSSTASGEYSNARNAGAIASGNFSNASGNNTTASGDTSNASGYSSTASGDYSNAHGYSVVASSAYATAIGFETVANGLYNIATGYRTRASNDLSISAGEDTIASGNHSIATGVMTTASGGNSFTVGQYLTAGPTIGTHLFGAGINNTTRLINNTSFSFMIGYNETTPTFTVTQSSVDIKGTLNMHGDVVNSSYTFISSMTNNGYFNQIGSVTVVSPTTNANIVAFGTTTTSMAVTVSTNGYTKLGGTEQLKFWTYTHTLTAGEVAGGSYTQSISVTPAKVRSISGCIYLVGTAQARTNVPAESPRAFYITSATSMTVYLAAGSGAENDICNVTILEAQ